MTYFITTSVFLVVFVLILGISWFTANILNNFEDWDYCGSWAMSSLIAAIAIVYALFEKGLLMI